MNQPGKFEKTAAACVTNFNDSDSNFGTDGRALERWYDVSRAMHGPMCDEHQRGLWLCNECLLGVNGWMMKAIMLKP